MAQNQIILNSNEDIDNLNTKIAKPDHVGACRNPKCPICRRGMHRTMMTIAENSCWKCDKPMKLAFYRKAGSILGPEVFSQKELDLARSNGVIITEHYSKTARANYLANICACGAFVGDHFFFTYYAAPAEYGEIPSKQYEEGYHCEICTMRGDFTYAGN